MKTVLLSLCLLAAAALPSAAQEKPTVRIGFIGNISGDQKSNGLGGRNSAELAVREWNAKPEAKYRYSLIVFDDECNPEVGVEMAARMATDTSIVAGVAHYCSVVAVEAIEIYHKCALPVVVWGAVVPEITIGNFYPEIHRINGNQISQNDLAAAFMASRQYKKWVAIYEDTDYGRGHIKHFSSAIKQYRGEMLQILSVPVTSRESRDFSHEISIIRQQNPDVVYYAGLTNTGVALKREMDSRKLDVQFQGTSGIISEEFITNLGAAAAEGALAFRGGTITEKQPGGMRFLQSYGKEPDFAGTTPDAYGAFAYASAHLLITLIEEVGPDRIKVKNRLNLTKTFSTITGDVTFDESGENQNSIVSKFIVQDGKWTAWEDSDYFTGKRKLIAPRAP